MPRHPQSTPTTIRFATNQRYHGRDLRRPQAVLEIAVERSYGDDDRYRVVTGTSVRGNGVIIEKMVGLDGIGAESWKRLESGLADTTAHATAADIEGALLLVIASLLTGTREVRTVGDDNQLVVLAPPPGPAHTNPPCPSPFEELPVAPAPSNLPVGARPSGS